MDMTSITLNEFRHMVKTIGHKITVVGQAEPGIGKSAQLDVLASELPTHIPCYIDCTLLDLGEVALPLIEEQLSMKVTEFAPNARFGFQHKQPVIIMLDELGKALRSVKNVLLTLILEHRIGDVKLPEGSIVFGTTNLTTDGVGDSLEAHVRNRMAFVQIKKPEAGFNADGSIEPDSWAAWALNNDIHPIVLAWVKEYPQALASYTEGESQKDNPYIFVPTRAGQSAFVTPRSLEQASDILHYRDILGENATTAALAGCIGESAARDMAAYLVLADKLPVWQDIINNPEGTQVPKEVTTQMLLVFSIAARITEDTVEAAITYIRRLPLELQVVFFTNLMRGDKQRITVQNKQFVDWAVNNSWVL